jgi:DNA polymerase-3 subunit alpha (Gram-positive type)
MERFIYDLIDWKNLGEKFNINESKLYLRIEDSYIDKKSLIINLNIRLNFVLPYDSHKFLKYKILNSSDHIKDVVIKYEYDDMVISDLEAIKTYIPYMSDSLKSNDKYLLRFIRTNDIDVFDENMVIKSVGEVNTQRLNKSIASKIEKEIEERLNLSYNIRFNLCEDTTRKIKEYKLEEEELEKKALNEVRIKGATKDIKSSKSSFSKRTRMTDKPAIGNFLVGGEITGEIVPLTELRESMTKINIKGLVFHKSGTAIKSGRIIFNILLTDKKTSFCCKLFLSSEKFKELDELIKEGDTLLVNGDIKFDEYEKSLVIMANKINKTETDLRKDECRIGRRVELHVHTKMSDNDGFNDITELIKTAADWGHKAVAITDHGVVQAFPDAANIREKLLKKGKEIKVIYGLEGYLYDDKDAISQDGSIDYKKRGTNHIIILAKNQQGLRNLYKLVSYSHLDYFYKRPRIPKSVLNELREGLILGGACEAGEVFRAVTSNMPMEEILKIADYYDYMEIQPLVNNSFMIRKGMVKSIDELMDFNKKILEIGDRLGKLTVATTDSHYFDEDSYIFRNIIMSGIGYKESNSKGLYFRTTEEMLKEFEYLGEDRAVEVVITNTNKIAEMIEDVMPIANDKFPPKIKGADETLRNTCINNAHKIYGNPLPEVINERLETELNSIINHGYAVMYVSAQMLVNKSLEDGYLVGSRGSVGSSFAATMAGITEVNPLNPHYICPKCKYIEWGDLNEYDCGVDMPDMNCPECGEALNKDGYNIPFATFLGFTGNKEPDIDLNFAGEYQSTAHKYVGEIFGENNVFKAGTVATIADKTAYGYVMHYLEDNNYEFNKYDVDRLKLGCQGVKRTTGQHPGGIIIVPEDKEIYDFCPVQHPANATDTDIITTHFDYHKIEKNLLKLDILGHDIPSMIRYLQDLTGVDPLSIDLSDKKVMSIFNGTEALNILNKDYKFTHGSYAIPEFGTSFVRKMLDDIHPTTMSELIRISGFSHGTDVWLNNAQEFITKGIASMKEVISTRDDIMNYLILKGIDNAISFQIMEDVRKNKPLKEEQLEIMKAHNVPDWYIESCKRIQYMFPRAHAVAYVMMSFRMAWFKVYYPIEFYATYFTTKIDSFNAKIILKGIDAIYEKMEEVKRMGKNATKKELDEVTIMEVAYEMYSRGFEFLPPMLGKSQALKFTIDEGKIRLPYAAISGLGQTAALSLYEENEKESFKTLEDVRVRTKLSSTNIEELNGFDVFLGIPDSAQISIFDI